MRVAHVDAESGFSGGEVQVFLLMDGLRARGHENVLFCPPGSVSAERARAEGFEVRPVPMRNDLDVAAVVRLARGLRAAAPDLAHLHTGRATWLGGWAARWAGVPAITTRRQDRRVRPGLRTRVVYRALVRRAVAIAPAVADELRAGGVPPERIEVVWSTVDPARFQALAPDERARLRAELGCAAGDRAVLAAGTLVERKGFDLLIDAVARLAAGPPGVPPTVLWIAGEGPSWADLEARAGAHGLGERVRLLGRRADVPALLAACDVFAMPSRREGLGVAALEAMAAGRAIVGARVGGLAQAVEDGGTGLLVPPDDVAALADALARVLGDDDLRGRLAAAGPARVAARFLPGRMVADYERIYREVLDAARS